MFAVSSVNLNETKIHIDFSYDDIVESVISVKNNENYHVVLDLETTGLKPNYHEIVQVGMISLISKCAFSIYIRPKYHDWSSHARFTS